MSEYFKQGDVLVILRPRLSLWARIRRMFRRETKMVVTDVSETTITVEARRK